MDSHSVSRRNFLGGMAATVAAAQLARPARAAEGKIRAGLIGAGGRGNMMAQFIQAHGGYELAAVADYFPEVAEEAGAQFGVPAGRRFSGLDGYKRLLDCGLDAVFLETPPYCFPDHTEAAVAAGCHVFMAKPVACDVPGCLRVREAARRAQAAGKVFLVDFQTRTDPLFIEGIDRVHRGEIGPLGLLASMYTDEGFSDPPFEDTVANRLRRLIWVNDNDLGGGYLVNAGIHAVDVALWIAGSVPVAATGMSRVIRDDPHGDSHDIYAVTYEFAGGLLQQHRGEHLRNKFSFHSDCTAHGQKGFLETGYSGSVILRAMEGDWEGGVVQDLYPNGAKRNIAAFHDCVLKGDCANPTVEPSINANLATILGRDAAERRTRLTWDEMLRENRSIEPNLKGLKA